VEVLYQNNVSLLSTPIVLRAEKPATIWGQSKLTTPYTTAPDWCKFCSLARSKIIVPEESRTTFFFVCSKVETAVYDKKVGTAGVTELAVTTAIADLSKKGRPQPTPSSSRSRR
jgi:hypothetical protein